MAKQKLKIDFKGSIIIDKIKDLKKTFDGALESGKIQIVSPDVITEIDLTGVQLLQYMIHQLNSKKITTKWNLSIADELKLLLQKNGFSHLLETITK